nr:copia protein [Tanacetum cinerariifolium]
MTYPDEVKETLKTSMEVEPLDQTKLEDVGLNNHSIPVSSWKVPSFDELDPQPQPLPNYPSLDVSLGEEKGFKPPIKTHSPDSFRMKVVYHFTIHTPPLPHVASFDLKDVYFYYHTCIDDPKKRYGFRPSLLGQSGFLGVDFLNLEMIEDDWELESKEVSFIRRGLNLPMKPKELEKEKYKSLAIKARKVLSEEEASSSDSEDEEYAMAIRDFKKFFRGRGKFVHQPHDDKKNFRKLKEDKKEKEDRSEENTKKEEVCRMAHDNNEVCLKVKLEQWIKDIGCSRHMTGNKDLFSSYKTIEGDYNSTLWNRRLGYGNMRLIQSLSSKELVRNLPKLKFESLCDACNIGKQVHASHKAKNMVLTAKCLELLHMDLFRPSRPKLRSPPPKSSPLVGDDILECEIIENQEKDLEIMENEPLNKEIVNIKETKDHPIDSVI